MALATTKDEYIYATSTSKELLCLKKFLQELGLTQERYILYCDSQSAIHLSMNSSFHSKSKHIDVRYHWIRDVLEEKKMHIEKIHTHENGCHRHTNRGLEWSTNDGAMSNVLWNLELEVTRLRTLEVVSDETMNLGS